MAHIRRYRNKLKTVFLSIAMFLLGVVVTVLAISVYSKIKSEQAKKTREIEQAKIIAPYYSAKDFKLPKGLLQAQSTSSAKLKIPIVMYHYVEYVKDPNDIIRKQLDTSPLWFEDQLKILRKNNFQTYFVRDVPDILNGVINYDAKKSIVLTFDDGYEDFYTVVFPLLKKYNIRATVYIINDFLERRDFLTKAQVVELSHSGLVEIGAHTLDHVYLKTSVETVAREQIVKSKQELEELIGMKVLSFAYPYGAFNPRTVDIVKEASFSAAVSVIPGTHQSHDNLLYLYRIRPGVFTPSTMIKVLENYSK